MAFPRGRTRAATGGTSSGRGGGRGGMFGSGPSADFVPVPPERRGQTIRRILVFFAPYRFQVAIVLGAILATSFLGLINPILLKLLIDVAIPQQDFYLLNLFVGLMIVLPIITGLIGVGQTYLNNVIGQHVMQDLRGALYAHLQRCRCASSPRRGPARSRAGCPTTSAASRRSSPTRRRASPATSPSPSARSSRCCSSTGG